LEIISKFRSKNHTQPPILSWNTPVPVELESQLILHNQGIEKFIPLLITAAQQLEHAGADFLVLPCNTLHRLFNEITQAISIPMLNIISETANHIQQQQITKVGLMATSTSITSKLHIHIFSQRHISTIVPSHTDQQIIDQTIINILHNQTPDFESFNNVCNHFQQQGVENIVLGCTDLQSITPQINPCLRFFDSMEILAEATVQEIGHV
jgi:aspartate racemase